MHPVVELLLARMESNPEEFVQSNSQGRWGLAIARLHDYGSKEEIALVDEGVNRINMNDLHKMVMKELCAPKEAKLIAPAAMKQQMLDLWNKNNGA